MTPELYSTLFEDEAVALFIGKPDIDDPGLRGVRTAYGPTLFVDIDVAPSFSDRNCIIDNSYFSDPKTLEVAFHYSLQRLTSGVVGLLETKYNEADLFVRGLQIADWCYLGTASLRSGRNLSGTYWRYSYELDQKLPYELWVKLGGYQHWLLTLGDLEQLCSTAEECMAVIYSRWGKIALDVVITHYEGDSLTALMNENGECVIYHYKEDEFDKTSINMRFHGNPDKSVTFYTSSGHDIIAEAARIISRDEAIETIKKYVTTGDPGETVREY